MAALNSSGWRVEQADVKDLQSVEAAFALFDENDPLLVIYTGHGVGQESNPHPLICPRTVPFDLKSIVRPGSISYILDC